MKKLFLAFFLFLSFSISYGKQFDLQSPDGKITLKITVEKSVACQVEHGGRILLSSPDISMTLLNGEVLGHNPKIIKTKKNSYNEIITAPLHRRKTVNDNYNELILTFKGNYGLVFRVYNDGAVYRFNTNRNEPLEVENESVVFDFATDLSAWLGYSTGKETNRFQTAFQNAYKYEKISEFDMSNIVFLPTLVDMGNGMKICIIEADLENYPGMFIKRKEGSFAYEGVFAKFPKAEKRTERRQQQIITETERFIARTTGKRVFPWRGVVISTADTQLADNDMVYRLGASSRIDDVSWIRPGKVAWEWWNNWGISGVNFKSGINNDTYKYYIDFAHTNNIEYVVFDEGWSPPQGGDIMKIIPELDLQMLIDYAHSRNVGVVLWAVWNVLDDKLEEACKHYSAMGVKGFKIDFIDRDDQKAVDFVYRCAEMCAKYKLIVDFHGMYKPTGIQRTYPNIINFEGVFGIEEFKWANPDMPLYDVTFPFIRMLAGPVDYTQGAMRNANKKNFRIVYDMPMGQGTRCHQLATYVVFDSPFTMLCDSPTEYMKEPECLKFISGIPIVWNDTKILDGKVGEYIVTLRKADNNYYAVGALTNWDTRKLQLDCSFLGDGSYRALIYKDGANADKIATDYVVEEITVTNRTKLNINLAEGGGWVCTFHRQ